MSETEIAELKKKCALQELQIDYLKLLLEFSHNRLEEATGSKKALKVQLKKKEKESVIAIIMNHRVKHPD